MKEKQQNWSWYINECNARASKKVNECNVRCFLVFEMNEEWSLSVWMLFIDLIVFILIFSSPYMNAHQLSSTARTTFYFSLLGDMYIFFMEFNIHFRSFFLGLKRKQTLLSIVIYNSHISFFSKFMNVRRTTPSKHFTSIQCGDGQPKEREKHVYERNENVGSI